MSLPAAILDAKARVQECLRGDPRLVGVGVGKENGRFVIAVYGQMDALDFTCVGGVPVLLRRATPPVPQAAAPARVNGVALALGVVGIGAVASLVSRAGSGNADARRDPQVDTPAFRAWFKNSRVVDPDNGRPRVVYHGTTHDFDSFDLKNANPENHHGRGFYFTTAREDVGSNYATRTGPDVTSRVETQVDRFTSTVMPNGMEDMRAVIDRWVRAHPDRAKEITPKIRKVLQRADWVDASGYRDREEDDPLQNWPAKNPFTSRPGFPGIARWYAEQKIVGAHGGAVLPVYLSIQNPVDLRTNHGTWFDVNVRWDRSGDEILSQTGLGVRAVKVIRQVAERTYDGHTVAEEILGKLDTYEGFSARDLEAAVRGVSTEWETEDGAHAGPGQFLHDVYEKLGFDGIVEDAYAAFGTARAHGKAMPGIVPGTEHWVAFRPSQIKSAIGNRGTFSARSSKISANRGSAAKRAPAKKPARPAPRYVVVRGGGNGLGITRFLPDEHVLDKRVEWVDPKSLNVDPLDTERDPERLKSVLQRMRDGEPLPALIVYEGEQVIWDGHHRQLAALKLKLPLVPVQWLRYEPGDE